MLDIPANQASFHLRQLAKYGLIEEDPDAARDKRDRVWRVIERRAASRSRCGEIEKAAGRQGGRRAVFRQNQGGPGATWSSTRPTATARRRAPMRTVTDRRSG